MAFFMLSVYGIFTHKELLCFHKPLRIITSDFLERENIIDQSLVKKAAETLGFFTNSCKTFDILVKQTKV